MEHAPIEGSLRELFFPDEEKLRKIAQERNIKIIIADFPFDLKFLDNVALLNPLKFLHIGFFEAKYFFGFEKPVRIDKDAMIDFIVDMVAEGLMESTDGANLIWWAMKK